MQLIYSDISEYHILPPTQFNRFQSKYALIPGIEYWSHRLFDVILTDEECEEYCSQMMGEFDYGMYEEIRNDEFKSVCIDEDTKETMEC